MKVSEIINWKDYNFLIDNFILYIEDEYRESSLNICIHEKSRKGGSFLVIIYSYSNGKNKLCGTVPDREDFNENSYNTNGLFYCVTFYNMDTIPARKDYNMICLDKFYDKIKNRFEMVDSSMNKIDKPNNNMFIYFRALKNKA